MIPDDRADADDGGLGSTPFILGLGSNLGDRRRALEDGLDLLGRNLSIEAVSRVVESEPWGPVPQGPFLNLVLRGRTSRAPRELLEICRAAEAAAGRVRGVRFGPRTLDVDIIFFGDVVLEDPSLTIPHPRWRDRPFVYALLPEVSGDLPDPVSGRRIADEAPREYPPSALRPVEPIAWVGTRST